MPRRVLRQCRRLALYLFERGGGSVILLLLKWCEFRSGSDWVQVRFVRVSLEGLPSIHIAGCLEVFVFFWMVGGRNLPDGVAGAQTDPLGDGTVLALSFGKLLLGAESLVAL